MKFLRSEKLVKEANKINEFANRRKVEELYRSFKCDNSSFNCVKSAKPCDPNKLKEFFKQHFTSSAIEKDPIKMEDISDFIDKLQRTSIQIDTPSPTKE